MRKVSLPALLAVLLALAGCVLAGAVRDWGALAICLSAAGAVSGLLSLREDK